MWVTPLQRPSVVPTGGVKRHARGRHAHGVCQCRRQHQYCGCACVVYVPRVCVSGLRSFQLRARFRSERGQTEYKQRVLECWSGFAAYQHQPTAAAAGTGWHPPRHTHMPTHTHAHSNHHQVRVRYVFRQEGAWQSMRGKKK